MHGQLSTRDQAEFNGFSWVGITVDAVKYGLLNHFRWQTGPISETLESVIYFFHILTFSLSQILYTFTTECYRFAIFEILDLRTFACLSGS